MGGAGGLREWDHSGGVKGPILPGVRSELHSPMSVIMESRSEQG